MREEQRTEHKETIMLTMLGLTRFAMSWRVGPYSIKKGSGLDVKLDRLDVPQPTPEQDTAHKYS